MQEHADRELGIQSRGVANSSDKGFGNQDGDVNTGLLPPALAVPTTSSTPAVLEQWATGFKAGCELLGARVACNVSQPSLGGVWPHELSLVATYADVASASPSSGPDPDPPPKRPGSLRACSHYNDLKGSPVVLVVAWVDPVRKVMSGRVCDVKDGKVLALVPARHSLMDFTKSEIILNTIGLRPHKEGPKNRPSLPDIPMRLKHMWETAIARLHASKTESLTVDACVSCSNKSASSTPEGDDGEAGEAVFTCPVCMLPWHLSCSEKLVTESTSFNFECLRPDGNEQFLPKRFVLPGPSDHNAVCHLCLHMNLLCTAKD